MINEFQPSFSFVVSLVDETGSPENASAQQAIFQEVSGLSSELTPETLEGGENRFVHRLPSAVKHSNLILKRGIIDKASEMQKWLHQTLERGLADSVETRTLQIALLDEENKALMALDFAQCLAG